MPLEKDSNSTAFTCHDITMTSHEHHVVVNPQSFDCLFNSIGRPTSKKHQSLHYWPFVRGIHWRLVNSLHKRPITQKKGSIWSCHVISVAPQTTQQKSIDREVLQEACQIGASAAECIMDITREAIECLIRNKLVVKHSHLLITWGPFYEFGLTLIKAWIGNHMPNKMWVDISLSILKGCTVEVNG